MIYVKPLQTQGPLEMKMVQIFGILPQYISAKCRPYAVKALCLKAFPPCDLTSKTPKPRELCKDECWLLERYFCAYEFSNVGATYMNMLAPKCSNLPDVGSPGHKKCVRLNLTSKFTVHILMVYRGEGSWQY
jgi:hypothetical protein